MRWVVKTKMMIVPGALFCLYLLSGLGWHVLAQSSEPDSLPPDFFIEVEIDNTTPYLGQQVTYMISRYHAVSFPNSPYYEDHLFTGFWHVPLIQRPSYTTTIAGRVYSVRQTHLALFPTRLGSLRIAPTRLVIPNDGPEADLILESEAIDLEVQSLPAGAPADFNGAVGQFGIETKLSPTEGRVNEVMTLTVEISGSGNIPTLNSPPLPQVQYWRFFDQQIITDIPLSREVVKGARRFQWSVVPGRAGEQEFPLLKFSFYDPTTKEYYTVETVPLPVVILPGLTGDDDISLPGPGEVDRQQVVRVAVDIRHIKPVPAIFEGNSLITMRMIIYGFSFLTSLLAVGAAWSWQRWQQRYGGDTASGRRRQAREKARRILSQADDPHQNVYALAYRAFSGYMADQFDQPVVGMTFDQLVHLLNQARVNPELTARLQTLLAQAETRRFAPPVNQEAPPKTFLAEAHSLLDDLETFFKRRRRG